MKYETKEKISIRICLYSTICISLFYIWCFIVKILSLTTINVNYNTSMYHNIIMTMLFLFLGSMYYYIFIKIKKDKNFSYKQKYENLNNAIKERTK